MISNWTMLFLFILVYVLLNSAHRGTRRCRCQCRCSRRRGCRR